jgi:hypothetical protein
MEVGSFEGGLGPQVTGYQKLADFRIKQKQFIVIALCQLKKNFHLLAEKSFMKNRENEFPYELYDKLLSRLATVMPQIL